MIKMKRKYNTLMKRLGDEETKQEYLCDTRNRSPYSHKSEYRSGSRSRANMISAQSDKMNVVNSQMKNSSLFEDCSNI